MVAHMTLGTLEGTRGMTVKAKGTHVLSGSSLTSCAELDRFFEIDLRDENAH